MSTLIAEDLLLLLLDDETGVVQHAPYLDPALGGALLVELSLGGHVEAVAQDKVWGFTPQEKVRVTGRLPRDEMLRASYDVVAEKERIAQDLVTRLGRRRKEPLLERLVQRGLLRREEGKVLGLFPRTTWPEVDGRHEAEVRTRLEAVLLRDGDPDDRTGALVALLAGLGAAEKVVTGPRPRREVKVRAQTVGKGEWAAEGVRAAIASAQGAMAAAAVVTAAAAGSS